MKRTFSFLSSAILFLLIFAPVLRAQPTCVEANGLNWCYDDQACGEACNDVCAALGLVPEDNQVWFEAQNTESECQVISEALGLGNTVFFGGWAYACLEDTGGTHTVGGGLIGPLYCSDTESCPQAHRTEMDQIGTPCGPNSRRSVCPCTEPPAEVLGLSPESSSGPAGSDQTVTAYATSDGDPLPGVQVTFRVISGPGEGKTSGAYGECSNPGCFTGPDGLVSWTYSNYAVGTDTVTASFEGAGGEIASSSVEVIWTVLPIPTLSGWGLIAAAALMGVAGYMVVRRRRSAYVK